MASTVTFKVVLVKSGMSDTFGSGYSKLGAEYVAKLHASGKYWDQVRVESEEVQHG